MSELLYQAIQNKTATVGVIGLGYVGLPLIDAFVNKGFTCLGFDVDTKKVDDLNAGRSYIKHISSEKVQGWKAKKQFDATTDMNRLREADAILICVPTPLNESRDPEFKAISKLVTGR